ncbi:MAG TPA: glycosyltransferase family 1 protein, partial [Vicinamibacterales bacterium]|nr:glycosyltransferase family 1 protein [Vicinamibacterales bacterium]
YRYAVDLINGLLTYASDVRLTVFGSNARPREEFAPAINDRRRCHYVHLPPTAGRGYVYRDVARLTWRLATSRVDLCHQLHTYFPFPKPCPVVVTAYHYYEDRLLFDSRPYRYYLRSLRRRADAVITLSDATREDFHTQFAVPLDRMRTVYCGLSPALATSSGKRRSRPYVLSPYNLSATKNLGSLIAAWPAIAAGRADIDLVLYGRSQLTPEREADFDRLLASTAHSDRVQRVGFVAESDLADLFAGCELFIFPTTVEGFGYPLLEAMAHGACCITRNASAMREVGGDAVRLVETRSPDEIARAANELLEDAPHRAELGARAAERARQFTVEAMVRKTVDCYRSLT